MVDPVNEFFNRVYESLFQRITCYVIVKCNSIADGEDIVQEVFSELYRLIKRKGISYIKNTEAMAMRITNFKLQRYYKFKKAQRIEMGIYKRNENGGEYEMKLDDIDIERKYINAETVNEIWKYLKNKPADTQKIFALFYYSDKTIKDISILLNETESFVKHRLYRTINEIRSIYQKAGEAL